MLAIQRVIVPPHAGVLSALGLAMTSERRESMASVMKRLDDWSARDQGTLLDELAERAWPTSLGEKPRWRSFFARMRYVGQGHELDVPLDARDRQAGLDRLFAKLHQQRYGFTLAAAAEVVSVRHVAEGTGRRVKLEGEGKPPRRRLDGPVTLALADATLFVAKGWRARFLDCGAWSLKRA
jgi:N-methylhydantoinase A/oxoprolinase/acetone carboxylase beta subunit